MELVAVVYHNNNMVLGHIRPEKTWEYHPSGRSALAVEAMLKVWGRLWTITAGG